MTLADLSRIMNGSRIINYEDVVFQRRKEVLDSEINLVQKLSAEKLKDITHQIIKLDHGFVKKTSFSNPGLNHFYMGTLSTDVNRAFVNGHIIEIRGSNTSVEYQNKIVLPPAPTSPSPARTDFVWLEIWVSEILPNKSIADGISKPTKQTIYKYGNINFGGTNLEDENLDVSFGVETAVRSQIQYQIRVAENASSFSSPTVLAKDSIHSFSQATDIITGEVLNGLYLAHNTLQTYGRFEVDENNNPLTYGYHYAIPLCTVVRDPDETSVNLSNITDVRQSIGISTLDPDIDYTINGLIIQNNSSDATIVLNTADVNDKSRIVFKRGGIIVGTLEAFDLTRVGFGDKNQLEFISFETDTRSIGVNTVAPSARFHVYEDETKIPVLIENNNTANSLDIETMQSATAIRMNNTVGSTTSDYFLIQESGNTRFKIGSDGKVSIGSATGNPSQITSLSNHLSIFADGLNELRLGYGGGGDIALGHDSLTEFARWNNVTSIFQLGVNNTAVTFGGGYGATGATINPTGAIYTDNIIQSISSGVYSAEAKTGSADGYLYLGLESGSFSQYLKWNNTLNRFELSHGLYINSTYPLNIDELQVNYISSRSNLAGDPISSDAAWTIGGYTGKKLIIASHLSDSNTHVFEVQNSSGTPVAYIDELGDMRVNDLYVNGVETVGSVSRIDTTSIETNTLTVFDNTTLGNASTDIVLVTGNFKTRSTTSDSKLNFLVDSAYGAVAINNNAVSIPSSINNIFLNVSGGIGSIYEATDNAIPKMWVGEDFGTTTPMFGGISWDINNNWMWLQTKTGASTYGTIQALTSNFAINITSKTPEEKLDVEGNLSLANYDNQGTDRMIRFRNWVAAVPNESRIVYESATNKMKFLKASIDPNMTLDMNTSRVGIGTITPSSKLHLYSINDNDGLTITGQINGGAAYSKTIPINFVNYAGSTIASIKAYHDSTVNNLGKLAFFTSGNQKMVIDNDGYVGIGTPIPLYQLSVRGNSTNAITYIAGAGSASYASLTLSEDDTSTLNAGITRYGSAYSTVMARNVLDITTSNNGNIVFRPNGTGNVGIGTLTPALKFVVSNLGVQGFEINPASSVITGGIDVISYNRSTTAYAPMVLGASVYDFTQGNIGVGITNPSKNITILPSSQANGLLVRETDNGNDAISVYGYNAGGVFTIYQNGTSIFYVDGTGSTAYYTGGSLGIGTITPDHMLSVSNSASTVQAIFGQDVAGGVGLVIGNENAVNKGFRIITNQTAGVATSVDMGIIGDNALTIMDGGFVGIGATNPSDKVEIQTSGLSIDAILRLTATNSASAPSGQTQIIATSEGGAGTNSALIFKTRTTGGTLTEAMRINSSQYVGIGTNPQYSLDIQNAQSYQLNLGTTLTGTSSYTIMRLAGADTTCVGFVGIGGTAVSNTNLRDSSFIGSQSNHSTKLITNNLVRLTILNDGKVGIGTTIPADQLSVFGTTMSLTSASSGDVAFNFGQGSGVDEYGVLRWDSAGNYLSLSNQANANTLVVKDGRVGIGTTTISDKLVVIGSARFGSGATGGGIGNSYISISDATLANSRQIYFYANDGTYEPRAWINHTATATTHSMTFDSLATSGSGIANWIFKTGMVGVGTTVPALRLHAHGVQGVPATTGTAQTGILRLSNTASNNVLDFGAYGATQNYALWIQGTNSGALNTNYNIVLNPNGVYNTNGYVGIGTTPQVTLDVNGDLKIRGTLTTTSNTLVTNLNADLLDGQQGSYYLASGSITGTIGYIPKYTGTNTLAISSIYDSGSSVGIGTNTPSEKLFIAGCSANGIILSANTTTTEGTITFNRSQGTIGTPTNVISGDVIGSIFGASYIGGYQKSAAIKFWAEGTISGTSYPSKITFETTPNGSTTRSISTTIYPTYVSIPTSLSVSNGTGYAQITLYSGSSSEYTYISSITRSGFTNSVIFGVNFGSSANTFVVGNAGNVGIGVTDPQQQLHITGQFKSDLATGTAPISVASTTVCTNLNAGMVDNYNVNAGTTNRLLKYIDATNIGNSIVSDSGTNVTVSGTLQTTGNVGIRKAPTTTALVVNSTSTNTIASFWNNDSATGAYVEYNGDIYAPNIIVSGNVTINSIIVLPEKTSVSRLNSDSTMFQNTTFPFTGFTALGGNLSISAPSGYVYVRKGGYYKMFYHIVAQIYSWYSTISIEIRRLNSSAVFQQTIATYSYTGYEWNSGSSPNTDYHHLSSRGGGFGDDTRYPWYDEQSDMQFGNPNQYWSFSAGDIIEIRGTHSTPNSGTMRFLQGSKFSIEQA